MSELEKSLHCSFCLKPSEEVVKLIAGPSVYICDSCIDLCHNILYKKDEPKAKEGPKKRDKRRKLPSPREITAFLDQYIIGQDDAKQAISVAVYNHYKRLRNPVIDDVELEKSNILLIGPTGCGKTLFAKSVARLLDVPFAIADATSLTESGYVGDDVESVISRLLLAADNDVERAQTGIIYIDEIDKKARRGDTVSGSRDVSGEGVQQALLKLMEGSEVFVSGAGAKRGFGGEQHKVDTRNILFICGGAFTGIDKIIAQAKNKDAGNMGFGSKIVGKAQDTLSDLIRVVEPEHLTSFGMIAELIGRLPILAPLMELTETQLIQVMTEPKNAIVKQFEKLFGLDGIELVFEPDALTEVSRLAIAKKTGARGLRGVIERSLLKIQYDLPELRKSGVKTIIITKDVIASGAAPMMVYQDKFLLALPKQ